MLNKANSVAQLHEFHSATTFRLSVCSTFVLALPFDPGHGPNEDEVASRVGPWVLRIVKVIRQRHGVVVTPGQLFSELRGQDRVKPQR